MRACWEEAPSAAALASPETDPAVGLWLENEA